MRAPLSDLPLVLDNVSLQAGATMILDRVSLAIAPGAPTLIIGPNGSGKTTLLRLCMGLARPSAGRVSWGGRADSPPARRAILFQRPVMLRRSAAANVAYALAQAGMPRRQRAGRIAALLERVGLADLAHRDEPTASLDPAATRAVEEIVLMAAQSGIKIVMASHDLGQVRRLAGDVVFLVRGALCERGPAADFLDHPTTQEAAAFLCGDLVI